ncbi:MAG: NAD(P)H-hydrate dehydratase, partial [Lentisphaeria bacterium]
DSIVLGPGIGRAAETAEALAAVLATEKPLLIDADALRLTAGKKEEIKKVQNLILTPHPGEMQVVLKGLGREDLLTAEREEQAKTVAQELGAVVVLKGQGTLIAGPGGRIAINTSGNNALASGGTGDVLSGLIGGFSAQGYSGWDAACLGVYVHGRAAEIAVGAKRSLIADDLLNHIGEVFCELSPFE